MALRPSWKLAPEWAAFPLTSITRKTPPLRPVTTFPEMRPGSALKTARAPLAVDSMVPRDAGEPISSSLVKRPTSGAGAPPKRWKAASTKAFITRPAFMSQTPGP